MDNLCTAISEEKQQTVRELLKDIDNLDIPNSKNEYPLELACKLENPIIVELLLKHGANPNQQFDGGKTAMHILTQKGITNYANRCLHELVVHNANPNIRDDYGHNAIYYALLKYNTKIAPGHQWDTTKH